MNEKDKLNLKLDLIREFTETEGVKQLVDVLKEIVNHKESIGFKAITPVKKEKIK